MVYTDNALRAEDRDTLDRDRVANALAHVLCAEGTETPLVVGIFGGWGTGKTSLMKRLQQRVTAGGKSVERVSLWFDAWQYARQEQSLWRALILTLIKKLEAEIERLIPAAEQDARDKARKDLERLRESLYRSMTLKEREGYRVNWGSAAPLAADLALRFLTAGLSDELVGAGDDDGAPRHGPFARVLKMLAGSDAEKALKLIEAKERERYVDEVTSMEQFQETFKRVLDLAGIGLGKPRRLFVFVDDLDRCLPDDSVAALEAIKLFLDLPGCVFVLGMDRTVVEPGIRARYKPFVLDGAEAFDPGDYLDKIIQIPFTLPPLGEVQLSNYMAALEERDGDGIVKASRDLVELVVPDNPRSVKRFFNVLRLIVVLDSTGADGEVTASAGSGEEERTDRIRCFAKLVLLQMFFEPVYDAIVSGKLSLVRIEQAVKNPQVSGQVYQLEQSLLDSVNDRDRLVNLMDVGPSFEHLDASDTTATARLLTLSQATANVVKS